MRKMTDTEAEALVERASRALDVPEPSPLFWDHFPDRVRTAIAADAATAAPATLPVRAWWRRPVAAATLALVIVAGATALTVTTWRALPAPDAASSGAGVSVDRSTGAPALSDGDAWAVVSSTAATAGVDVLGEAGFGVSPGDADAALDDLTADERAAFAAILRAEMEGEGTGEI